MAFKKRQTHAERTEDGACCGSGCDSHSEAQPWPPADGLSSILPCFSPNKRGLCDAARSPISWPFPPVLGDRPTAEPHSLEAGAGGHAPQSSAASSMNLGAPKTPNLSTPDALATVRVKRNSVQTNDARAKNKELCRCRRQRHPPA